MRDFFAGVWYLVRGIGWVARRPRQWLFGLVPAVIVLAAYVAGLVALGVYDGRLARLVTPFADGWSGGLREATRLLVEALVFGGALLVAVVTFTGVTLLVGGPFYESLAVRVEEAAGRVPDEVRAPVLRQVADAAVVAVMSGLVAVLFLCLGLVPAIGQTVVPVAAAVSSGYFLTLELTAIALERRGLRRRERLAALRRNRALSVGFGTSVFVVFLVPLGAVLAMPAAVAGGTLLVRERLVGDVRVVT